jgi:hypothetical protein
MLSVRTSAAGLAVGISAACSEFDLANDEVKERIGFSGWGAGPPNEAVDFDFAIQSHLEHYAPPLGFFAYRHKFDFKGGVLTSPVPTSR